MDAAGVVAHSPRACDPLPCLTALCHSLVLSGDLILPSPFCQGLLLHPRPHPHPTGSAESGGDASAEPDGISNSIVEGLPVHPLYAHLAAALYRWILGGHFPRNLAPIAGINEDESWKSRLDEWTDRVVTQGSALLEVMDSPPRGFTS